LYENQIIKSLGQLVPIKFSYPFNHKLIFGFIQILSLFMITFIAFF